MTMRAEWGIHRDGENVWTTGADKLVVAMRALSKARTMAEIQGITRDAARDLTGADGATLTLRDGDECCCVEQNGLSSSWKGLRGRLSECVSGWAMLTSQTILIDDIYDDSRVPVDAFRSTFVKSMLMVPVHAEESVGAIGNFWVRAHRATREEVALLEALADGVSAAIQKVQLSTRLQQQESRCSEAAESVKLAEATAHRELLERRRSDLALRESEERFQQLQKMASLGQLAGGIAHDFNNMLSVILSASELVLDTLSDEDPNRVDLAEVLKAGQSAGALARQLLVFSHSRVHAHHTVELGALVRGIGSMLRRVIGETICLDVVTEPGLSPVQGDAGQIEQVLVNLVVNARDAMPRGGRVRIEVKHQNLDQAQALSIGALKGGDHVVVSVSDSGVGMDEATQAHIFEPFFTTKPPTQGTGLGLATVQNVVRKNGGQISVHSQPDHGTTFTLYLPCCACEPTSPSRELAPLSESEDGGPIVVQRTLLYGRGSRSSTTALHCDHGVSFVAPMGN